MHEAQLHKANCFITLTYNDEYFRKARGEFEDSPPRARRPAEDQSPRRTQAPTLPNPQSSTYAESLNKRDAQLFMKRLRQELTTRNPSTRIRFYLVGEYGDLRGRPHFHAAIFGEDFSADRYAAGKSPSGEQLYRSPTLEKLWTHGYSSIGDLTFESAAYIARYITKKITGKAADEHYKRINAETGEIYYITPEFNLMSRRPGIGKEWIDRYGRDVYPHDYVIMGGTKHKPPRYYDKLLERVDRELATLLKLEREFSARSKAADNTPRRLAAKEKVAQARLNQSKRTLK